MALITFEDLPSANTPLNAANLNNNFNELNNKLAVTTLWEGDVSPTALDSSVSITTFSDFNLRPYNYSICCAIGNINSVEFAIPFIAKAATSKVYSVYADRGDANACVEVTFNGYAAMSMIVKSITGTTVNKIHITKIVGIK